MRISDLSRQSGVPVATIKFYQRAQLLPPGEPTGRNQAHYGKVHLRRLRLIKTLTSLGELDLTSVRRLLAAAEDDEVSLIGLFEELNRVQIASKEAAVENDESMEFARKEVDRIIDSAGWDVRPDAAARLHLGLAIAGMRRLGCDCDPDFLDAYRDAADRLAALEIGRVSSDPTGRAAHLTRSILLREALTAMRELGQEHYLARQPGLAPAPSDDS
ncbi:MerR family transcriptional regulator [Actinoplanes cyaneus]|uniref:MerR family transcriptional regulator n=1 Tax=Actinoplanes cyaneus TaxID=52696 RepID=A0A919IVK4_9ACTN|nr:MerR family transcriptional regulator [Actinoplanes cyaneus]MCW2138176.1 DNA-binding transcriptional regulator, MerR family [Actinoplanes cyaneus]GID70528.1 MerR family transcriptional regulator [Actinoplanes cyaneus]